LEEAVAHRILRCLCLLAVAASGCAPTPPAARRVHVRVASGTPGGSFFVMAGALARGYAAALPGIDVEVYPSDGSASNLVALERGDADIGFSHADTAYLAFAGRLEERLPPFARLRGVAMLQVAPVHIVVRAGSGISDVGQLRGRRICLGLPRWETSSTVARVLDAFGVRLSDTQVVRLPFDQAAARLADGSLDALLVTGSCPMASVTTATAAGGRLLPIDGPVVDRLRRAHPFFTRVTIPAATYPRQPAGVRTIGVRTLLACRADLDEQLVHDLTRQLFAMLPLLTAQEWPVGQTDLLQVSSTPIPLHEGAARYYREHELGR
jgi:TRAP transporter TAXI family solute receptor